MMICSDIELNYTFIYKSEYDILNFNFKLFKPLCKINNIIIIIIIYNQIIIIIIIMKE